MSKNNEQPLEFRRGKVVDKDLSEQLALCLLMVRGWKLSGRKPKNKDYDKGFDIGFEVGVTQGILIALEVTQDLRDKGFIIHFSKEWNYPKARKSRASR